MEAETIQVTKEYDKFSYIKGNRALSNLHVARLTKEIAKENLLKYNPILVNEKFEIIDGQHRFEVAKANKLPLYYIVLKGGTIAHVHTENAGRTQWSANDYITSFATLGNKNYQLLLELKKETGMTYYNLVEVLSAGAGASGGNAFFKFKRGLFEVTREDWRELVDGMVKLKPFVPSRIWSDRDFVRACLMMSKSVSLEQLAQKVEETGERIVHQLTASDYLVEFQRILNFGKRKKFYALTPLHPNSQQS